MLFDFITILPPSPPELYQIKLVFNACNCNLRTNEIISKSSKWTLSDFPRNTISDADATVKVASFHLRNNFIAGCLTPRCHFWESFVDFFLLPRLVLFRLYLYLIKNSASVNLCCFISPSPPSLSSSSSPSLAQTCTLNTNTEPGKDYVTPVNDRRMENYECGKGGRAGQG